MVSCKHCGQQDPGIRVFWTEKWLYTRREFCRTEIDLPFEDVIAADSDGEVSLNDYTFREDWVGQGDYTVDTEEEDTELDGWKIDCIECGSCGHTGQVNRVLTGGDELDVLLIQLGNALKGRR